MKRTFKILIEVFIIGVLAIPIVWYFTHPDIYMTILFLDELVNASVAADCEGLKRFDEGVGEERPICRIIGHKTYKYRGVDVIEASLECEGITEGMRVMGMFRGDIVIDWNMGWLDKKITVAHEYCHYMYAENSQQSEWMKEGLTCDFVPLMDSLADEERTCYWYGIKPWNWFL